MLSLQINDMKTPWINTVQGVFDLQSNGLAMQQHDQQ